MPYEEEALLESSSAASPSQENGDSWLCGR